MIPDDILGNILTPIYRKCTACKYFRIDEARTPLCDFEGHLEQLPINGKDECPNFEIQIPF